jgi:hypothetical protein
MSFSHSPQSIANGFISMSRNIYLTSTVGMAMFGYSSSFKLNISQISIRILSIGVFAFSLIYLLNTTNSFKKYIKNLEEENPELPYYIDIKSWKTFVLINYIYLAFLAIIILFSCIRTSNFIGNKF